MNFSVTGFGTACDVNKHRTDRQTLLGGSIFQRSNQIRHRFADNSSVQQQSSTGPESHDFERSGCARHVDDGGIVFDRLYLVAALACQRE